MSEENKGVSREEEMIVEVMNKPLGARLLAYTKLSGPGWLQSAITLGGGSLAGSLYLGVLAGFALMWLQPLAMILGVVMLSAIAYVALSSEQSPFRQINEKVNPVLGWGWAIATAMANIVWCLPQFSLGTAAVRQNLLPGVFGADAMPDFLGKLIVAGGILAISLFVIWFYDKGRTGIKIFEGILKALVGVIILCFFGVVVKMTMAGQINWGGVLGGLIPNPAMLTAPASTYDAALQATGEYGQFWSDKILGMQRDVMISAFATAVGINMTFLLPFSMLAKGWNRKFRGLAIFDLSTGLFIPFILATGCVVIASASQFHAQYDPILVGEAQGNMPKSVGQYTGNLDARLAEEMGAAFATMDDAQKVAARDALPLADKKMAAMLVKRDAFDLANSLAPLTGERFAHYVFGIGVVGMAISSIIILMLISGFVVCEMCGVEPKGVAHRLACLLPALGVLGPFVWSGKVQFWLAVPTSLFGMLVAPIAYWLFFFMMNSKKLLGENLPKGVTRLVWNALMLAACGCVTLGAGYVMYNNILNFAPGLKYTCLAIITVYIGAAIIVPFVRKPRT